MSRKPRAGEAAGQVTIRVTGAERELWQTAADASGASSLSDAARPLIMRWAIGIVELKLPPGKRKARLLASFGPAVTVQSAIILPVAPIQPRRKRCPRCNQLLYVVGDSIEQHMTPSAPFVPCVPPSPIRIHRRDPRRV